MTAIAFGQRLFGRVDKVDGRFYVATLCWHFCYLPLVPVGTYIVLASSMTGLTTQFEGVRISLSFKSWLVGWFRVTAIPVFSLLTLMSVALWFIDSPQHRVDWRNYPWLLGITAGCGLLLLASYILPGVGRATARRAAALQRKWEDCGVPVQAEAKTYSN